MKKALIFANCFILIFMIAFPSVAYASNIQKASFSLSSESATSIKIAIKSDGAKHIIYRSTSKSKGYKKVKTLSSKKLAYSDGGLIFSKRYYYKIKSVKGKNSSTTSQKSLTCGQINTLLVKNNDNNKIYLSWNGVSSVGGVEIYKSKAKNGQYTLIKRTSSNHYTDKNISCSSTYYYKIRTYKTKNKVRKYSAFSSVIKVVSLNHKYSKYTVLKYATCSEKGQEVSYCDYCDNAYVREIKMTPHTMTEEKISPTCTNNGYTLHTCTKCSYSYCDEIIEPTGHFMAYLDTLEPSCTVCGYTEYYCLNCLEHFKMDYKEPTFHSFVFQENLSLTPTCNGGYNVFVCENCGEIKEEIVPALFEHNFVKIVTEPTCTESGYSMMKCSYCDKLAGDVFDLTSPLSHIEGTHLTIDGEEYYNCSRCNQYIKL